MNDEFIKYILENNITAADITKITKLAAKFPNSPFQYESIDAFKEDTIKWVCEQINSEI